MMTHTCKKCGKEFKAKTSNRKYCSRKCFDIRNEHITKRVCLVCSEEFIAYPNWIKRGGGKFCSKKCQGISERSREIRNCEHCGIEFFITPSQKKYNVSRFCSHLCASTASRGVEKPSIQGENNHNWRGGVSFYPYGSNPYPTAFNDSLKEKIRTRDNYECQMCGITEEEHIQLNGFVLQVHHIDYKKVNCEEGNLVSLCNQCHGRTNYNREHWESYFKEKLLITKENQK